MTKMFSSLNTTSVAAGGALAALGGAGIIGGLMNVANHGQKLLDQQDKLQRAGISYNEVLKMQAEYYNKIAKSVPTSTAAEYLKTVNELRAVTGSTAEAAKLAPQALKIDALLGNTAGTTKSGEFYKLLRSSEMKGISTDAAKRDAFAEEAYKYIAAFGTKFTANDFQTLARRGGTAWMNAKPEALGPIAVVAADIGASGAGTTLMTLQQLQMGANTLSKQQGEVLEQLGLLDMSKVTRTGFGGGRLQVGAGGIRGSLDHMGDLPGWIKDVVYPAIEKAAHGDEAQMQALIAKLSPNRNAAKLIEMFGSKGFLDQQFKDIGLAGMQHPVDQAYNDYITRNPEGVKKAFADQYESMMQAIGAPIMQAAIPVMKGVTELFTNIGAWSNAHPEGIKLAAQAMGAIGGAMIILGGAAVVGAAISMIPGGAVIAAALGIGTIITTLAALNWDAVSGGLEWFGKAMATLGSIGWDALVAGVKSLGIGLGWLKDKISELLGYLGVGSASAAEANGHEPTSSVFGRMRHMSDNKSWLTATGTNKEHLDYIRSGALARGIDPNVVSQLVANEGLGHYTGDGGTSFGDFQLHKGGGLGDAYERLTGHSLNNTMDWKHQADWSLDWMAAHKTLKPWHGWHGASGAGLSGSHPVDASPRHRHVPGFVKKDQHSSIENVIVLDGKEIARSTNRHIVQAATHPTTAPYHDGSRHWTPPDAGIIGI